MPTRDDITRFQELYREHFGTEISRKEALEKGAGLLRFMSLIYRPMGKDELKIVQKQRANTLHLLQERITNL